ncbi:MAG TPA: bifunctional phosphopantothenoylcysteine decarboxylase/phosphopantothenate--cysteine ligase CoaBC [Ktedonobacterales bacterium]|nr:bifunctional phosphopantothenoylcysteine decarboxylase/phosphopantothenate--cysteine ligase CoaBC [Ktedonobacterales bacterium]
MSWTLRNKHLVVGVCGGIAAFKAVALVSQLQKAGALVDVVMTERASEFVSALSFSSLSHRPVYDDLWEPTGQAAARHIELGHEADLLVVVPATANTIAKLAHGMADNMLSAVALATTAPLLIAPAMEQGMYRHPATQANLALLRSRGAIIVEPEVGTLASGEVGAGRLPEPETLVQAICQALGRSGPLAGRRVVVTAGGTQEPIDPVRFIGNRSSGLMGYALAEEARDRGAEVTLIAGPISLAPLYGVETVRVQTALEMRAAVLAALGLAAGQSAGTAADALVMAAAVADYRVEHPAAEKMKKEAGVDGITLTLVRNPDILADVDEALKQARQPWPQAGQNAGGPLRRLVRVGFAAETTNLEAYARAKLASKGLDLLVANDVSRADSGFGTTTNKVWLLHQDGHMEDLEVLPKTAVAGAIWDRVQVLLE